MTILSNILAIILYLFTWIVIGKQINKQLSPEIVPKKTFLDQPKFLISLWFSAIIIHAIYLYFPLLTSKSYLILNFSSAISHVIWFTNIILLITNFKRQVVTMGIFILPFTISALLLQLIMPDSGVSSIYLKDGLSFHIFVSFLAYSMFSLAAIQALLLHFQNKHLHNHHPGSFVRILPALQDMESLLFRLILLGVILLSFSLLSGFVYFDNLFAAGIAHKTLLSIFAWVIFTILLIGHWKYGWRGRVAVRATLGGFILLMLSYFGSKFILEFIIN